MEQFSGGGSFEAKWTVGEAAWGMDFSVYVHGDDRILEQQDQVAALNQRQGGWKVYPGALPHRDLRDSS